MKPVVYNFELIQISTKLINRFSPSYNEHLMIELNDFGKDYGEFTAVKSVTMKIEKGELFGFIGPNGAGKSTSIRFLATLLKATRGDGLVNGFSVNKNPMDVRRSIGYMPDDFGVYDGMKVWEFLDFFATAYGLPRSKRRAHS